MIGLCRQENNIKLTDTALYLFGQIAGMIFMSSYLCDVPLGSVPFTWPSRKEKCSWATH